MSNDPVLLHRGQHAAAVDGHTHTHMHIYKLPLSLTAHTLFHSLYEDTHTHTGEDTVLSNFFPETEQITKS